MMLSLSLQAATLTYDADASSGNGITDGTTRAWNTTLGNAPWTDGTNYFVWPNGNTDIAVFGGGTSGTAGVVTVGAVTANGIIFNTPFAGTYTLSGGTITLDGTTPTITANASATISSALTGLVGLTKNGAGNLILSGAAANSYTGTTNVSAGTLTMNKTTGVDAVGGNILINGGVLVWSQANMVPNSASITMTSGGLQIAGMTETIANLTLQGGNPNNNTSSNGGMFTITDTLTINGTGTLGLNSGTQWSATKVDFTGAVSGVFSMTGNGTRVSQFTVGAGGLTLSGQTLSVNKGTVSNANLGSELILNGDVTASGSNNINPGSGTFGVSRVTMAATRTWNITAGTTNINNQVVGAGGLTKTGDGTLTLAGTDSNTYAGVTTVSGGTLALGKTGSATAIAGNVTVATGGTLDWNGNDQLDDAVNLTLSGGTLKFDNANETFASLTQTSGTVNATSSTNAGIVTITGQLRASGGSSIILNSGGVWSVGSADFTGFSGTAIALNGNSATRLNQFIVGSGGVTFTGQVVTLSFGALPSTLGSELTLNGNVTASGTNSINVLAAGGPGVAQVNLGAADRTFNITSGTTTSNAAIVGSGGGLTKSGVGNLALNAVNTYDGNTSITGGTLKLGSASSIDASPKITVALGATFDVSSVSAFSVKSGQTLEGGGTITGSATIASNAVLRAGTQGGDLTQKLTVSSALMLSTGSSTQLQINGATFTSNDGFGGNFPGTPGFDAYVDSHASGLGDHSQISVGTAFTQQTGAQIQVLPSVFAPVLGQIFNLIDWGSVISVSTNLGSNYRDGSSDGTTDLDLPDISSSGYAWDISHFATQGVVVVVPEPSRVMLLIFAGLLGFAHRRR